jgi:hypothetical protein
MSLESDLYNLLSTDASISGVLNARPFIYNGAIPKGQPDSGAIVLNVYRTDRLTGADGPNRFTVKEMQFDCYHAQYSQSVAIAYALIALIGNLSGSLATTEIQGTIPTREMDFGRESGDSGYVFRRMVAFEIQYVDLEDGDTANTYTPVSIPAPGGNATLLEGVLISNTPPADGQALIYNAAANEWQPAAVSGGGSGSAINFADSEVPSGAIDGANAVFTFLHTPVDGSLQCFKNLGITIEGIAYTRAANVITFNAGYIPQPGDSVIGFYRY